MAWRYWAMRGESLEPGGCSATPTSPRTAFSTAWPAKLVGCCGIAVAPVRVAVVAPALCSAVVNAVVGGAPVCAGEKRDCSCVMRAMATSRLTGFSFGRKAPELESRNAISVYFPDGSRRRSADRTAKPARVGQQAQRGHREHVQVLDEELLAVGGVRAGALRVGQFDVDTSGADGAREHRDRVLDVLEHLVEGHEVERADLGGHEVALDGLHADAFAQVLDRPWVRDRARPLPSRRPAAAPGRRPGRRRRPAARPDGPAARPPAPPAPCCPSAPAAAPSPARTSPPARRRRTSHPCRRRSRDRRALTLLTMCPQTPQRSSVRS